MSLPLRDQNTREPANAATPEGSRAMGNRRLVQQSVAFAEADQPAVLSAWWQAIRPHTLGITASPVIVGVAFACLETGHILWHPFLAALLGAALIQIGTNLHNDALDCLNGVDGAQRLGPRRASASGWLTPEQVRTAAFASFALAAIVGLYLVWLGGWPILAIGVGSIAAGLAYSGGPRPIAFTALGELFVFVFFGLVAVLGSYYLQSPMLASTAFVAAVALGLQAAAVLTVNNHRDRDSDHAAGRITLAHRLGSQGTKVLFALLLFIPFLLLIPLTAVAASLALPGILLPWAVVLVRDFWRHDPSPALNRTLAHTARLQFIFAMLLATGAFLAASAPAVAG
jgi:1,4-dihydroxy-2-naphthoate octaprenyltransferase